LNRASQSGALWAGFCAAVALGALLGVTINPALLDWQRVLAWQHPWRWWSAALVHLSTGHLLANLAGCLVVGAFGWAARCTRRDVAAWSVAWPITHLLLMLQPTLVRYAGLSGVLHAGVAVAAFGLVVHDDGRRRGIGLAVLAGLLLKVVAERPWSAAVQHWPGWDIPIVPMAHASGAAAGLACAVVAWATSRRRGVATIGR
jgi:rhomboid family GlyGly-CTERM serine protease